MLDHTELVYNQSLSIPRLLWQDVADTLERNQGVQFASADVIFLFEIWNRYMTKEKENINCSGCRTKVISKLKRIVAIWKDKGEIK